MSLNQQLLQSTPIPSVLRVGIEIICLFFFGRFYYVKCLTGFFTFDVIIGVFQKYFEFEGCPVLYSFAPRLASWVFTNASYKSFRAHQQVSFH